MTVPMVIEAHGQAGEAFVVLPNSDVATSSWDELVKVWRPANQSTSTSSRKWTCVHKIKVLCFSTNHGLSTTITLTREQQTRTDPDDEVMVQALVVHKGYLYSGYEKRVAVWSLASGTEVATWGKQKDLVNVMLLQNKRLYTWCSPSLPVPQGNFI